VRASKLGDAFSSVWRRIADVESSKSSASDVQLTCGHTSEMPDRHGTNKDHDHRYMPRIALKKWLAAKILGTTNQVTVTDNADGSVTLSTPQDTHTGATPQFARLGLGVSADATVPFLASLGDPSVGEATGTVAKLQRNDNLYLTLATPDTKLASVAFANPSSNYAAEFRYSHSAGEFDWRISTTAEMSLSSSAFGVKPPAEFESRIGIGTAPDDIASLALSSVPAMATSASVFLTSDSGVVKSRTAAQVLSDINALENSVATQRLLGRGTAGAGTVEEMALSSGAGLSFSWAASSLAIGATTDTPQFARLGLNVAVDPSVPLLMHRGSNGIAFSAWGASSSGTRLSAYVDDVNHSVGLYSYDDDSSSYKTLVLGHHNDPTNGIGLDGGSHVSIAGPIDASYALMVWNSIYAYSNVRLGGYLSPDGTNTGIWFDATYGDVNTDLDIRMDDDQIIVWEPTGGYIGGTATGLTLSSNGGSITMDGTAISSTQWGYLGALDQGLATTSTPQFARLGIGNAADGTLSLKTAAGVSVGGASSFSGTCTFVRDGEAVTLKRDTSTNTLLYLKAESSTGTGYWYIGYGDASGEVLDVYNYQGNGVNVYDRLGIGKDPTSGTMLDINFSTADLELIDAGTASATEAGWVQVEIGGSVMYLRAYASK
jgi:hypothetical protein